MDANVIAQYLDERMLVVVVVLWLIGMALKAFPVIKDEWIPFILGVVGIGLAFLLIGLSVTAFIQGILATGAAVYVHQLFKQAQKASDSNSSASSGSNTTPTITAQETEQTATNSTQTQ